MEDKLLYKDITYEIRGACFDVWKKFGGAFKEKVTERALKVALGKRDLEVITQAKIDIYYDKRGCSMKNVAKRNFSSSPSAVLTKVQYPVACYGNSTSEASSTIPRSSAPRNLYFEDEKVGSYQPDMIVNDLVLVELKSKPFLTQEDKRQFWLYLKGSKYKLGLLINFGTKKLEIERRIYDNARNKYKQTVSLHADNNAEKRGNSPLRRYQRLSASINT
jgi:hypothetical protein